MKIPVRVAFVCTLVSILITLTFFYLEKSEWWFNKGAMINMFLLLTSLSVGVFLTKKKEGYIERAFLEDLKVTMQGGIMFTVLISFFTYFYYSKIEVSLLEKFRVEKQEAKLALVPNEEAYLEMQKENIIYKDKTYMDFLENEEDKGNYSMNPTLIALIHTVVGMILTLFFSIFATIILRKIVLRS